MKTFVIALLMFVGSFPFFAMEDIVDAGRAFDASVEAQAVVEVEPAPVERVELKPVVVVHRYDNVTEEEVCMAQVLFSETKNNDHQVQIGWTVRNRVNAQFRGKTYCEVAFARGQFSALSYASDPQHKKVMAVHDNYLNDRLTAWDKREWTEALTMAKVIMNADEILNPVPDATYFWYLPAYESGNIRYPSWAKNKAADYVIRKPKTQQVLWAFYTDDNIG